MIDERKLAAERNTYVINVTSDTHWCFIEIVAGQEVALKLFEYHETVTA
jgi:hypothetical protein